MARVLLVDDEANVLKVLTALLQQADHEAVCAQSAEEALRLLKSEPVELVVSDVRLGAGMNGLELLHEVKTRHPRLPVVVITAYGTVELAVQAMKEGAFDFVRKPFKMAELLKVVNTALRHRRVSQAKGFVNSPSDVLYHFDSLVGDSAAMQRVYQMIERVGKTDTTVLIRGDSGTGKELVAKAIHSCSRRAKGPWVPVNCAALPAPLLESEIFGHAAGSFTGATQTRDGLFLAANRGTLFLDEVGSMDLAIQGKFLRALQERKIRRVGENVDVAADVRVIAATNEPLEAKRDAGEFREDLYYRISVIPIEVPALRERPEDIPLLVEHFCRANAEDMGHPITVGEGVMDRLAEYAWPGNIRELENAVACAATLSASGVVTVEDLPPNIAGDTPRADRSAVHAIARGKSLSEFLREKEKAYMELILKRTEGNRARAAELLGISRATLYRKLTEA